MADQLDMPDIAIARFATRQHGVVSSAQLRDAGLSREAVRKRVATGRLHRLYRGVYSVGHARLSRHGDWMAAVLACGDGAVLSHRSAAQLWGFLDFRPGAVHVSIPKTSGRARRPKLVLHRCPSLATNRPGTRRRAGSPLTTTRDDIPVTTVQRTLDDLHDTVPPKVERYAIRQAELAGFRLAAHSRARTHRTRSDLELAFLAFCRRQGVPRPEVNVRVGRWTVDFLWRERRVGVETDFFDYHRGSVAYEDDHVRELELREAGLKVRRYTGDQLRATPDAVAADLKRALSSWSTSG